MIINATGQSDDNFFGNTTDNEKKKRSKKVQNRLTGHSICFQQQNQISVVFSSEKQHTLVQKTK
jgi:hypothetical protein